MPEAGLITAIKRVRDLVYACLRSLNVSKRAWDRVGMYLRERYSADDMVNAMSTRPVKKSKQ